LAALEKSRNPVPGLSSKARRRIDKALIEMRDLLYYWLDETDRKMMTGWLPYKDIITSDNDMRQMELKEAYTAFGVCNKETGELEGMRDPGIKASNRIMVSTWYVTDDDRGFFLVKPVFSPLPHPEWGRLPLTLRQWNMIALALIGSRMAWQWLPGLIHYTGIADFEHSTTGINGWHMEPATALTQKEGASEWTADVILQPIINQFSLD